MISEDLGIKLENVRLEDLGQAKKIVIDKDNTTSVEGNGKRSDIEARVKQIRKQVEDTTSDITSLGDPFYTESTKATSIRVIDVSNGPKVEVSFSGNGTIRDSINVTDIGTIWTLQTSGGMIYSEGQGLLTTQQGEMATYTQQATGQITPEGRVVFHGSMFFKSLSPTGQLASLDNQMGIYNYESDIAGNAIRQVWEWQ